MAKTLKVVLVAFLAGLFVSAFVIIVKAESKTKPVIRPDGLHLNDTIV